MLEDENDEDDEDDTDDDVEVGETAVASEQEQE